MNSDASQTDIVRSWSTSRGIITFVGLFTAISPYVFDWNVTHIYNPHWPPHAKFHNAQTMLLGTLLGICAIWALWRPQGTQSEKLIWGLIFAGMYWATQAGAILFPGTALYDPEFASRQHGFNQLGVDAVVFVLLIVAFILGRHDNRGSLPEEPLRLTP